MFSSFLKKINIVTRGFFPSLTADPLPPAQVRGQLQLDDGRRVVQDGRDGLDDVALVPVVRGLRLELADLAEGNRGAIDWEEGSAKEKDKNCANYSIRRQFSVP